MGVIFLICYTKEEYINSKALFEEVNKLNKEFSKDIHFIQIDASSTLKTPSKILNNTEMGLMFIKFPSKEFKEDNHSSSFSCKNISKYTKHTTN
jgi:hypothetical protein